LLQCVFGKGFGQVALVVGYGVVEVILGYCFGYCGYYYWCGSDVGFGYLGWEDVWCGEGLFQVVVGLQLRIG